MSADQEPTIICFSNPFGFGPTGTILPVMRTLVNQWNGSVVFAGSELCREVVGSTQGIEMISLNERDPEAIRALITSYSNPYVLCSLNRFAIQVAHQERIPNALIDVLWWFWKDNSPAGFFETDLYFGLTLPGQAHSSKHPNFIPIPPTIEILKSSRRTNTDLKKIILQLGGCKDPLTNSIPENYLTLIAKILDQRDTSFHLFVCGGSEAMAYLSSKVQNHTNLVIESFSHEEYLSTIADASHSILTGGVSTTYENIALGIPTSYILPINQSQWALAKHFSETFKGFQAMTWRSYVDTGNTFTEKTEKEVIKATNSFALRILQDPRTLDKVVKDGVKLLQSIPRNQYQSTKLENLSFNGAEKVVSTLRNTWA